jgi:hypothetical protein
MMNLVSSTSGTSAGGLVPPRETSALIPLVERIERVRNTMLDCSDADWDAVRVELDRELRSISMELATQCAPAAFARA